MASKTIALILFVLSLVGLFLIILAPYIVRVGFGIEREPRWIRDSRADFSGPTRRWSRQKAVRGWQQGPAQQAAGRAEFLAASIFRDPFFQEAFLPRSPLSSLQRFYPEASVAERLLS